MISRARKRWTIAHELGHIMLGHLDLSNLSDLTDQEHSIYELEANTFARELLAPLSLCYKLRRIYGKEIMLDTAFDISHEAAANIVKYLDAWSTKSLQRGAYIYDRFHDFLYSKTCPTCKTSLITENTTCPHCGDKLHFDYEHKAMTDIRQMNTVERNTARYIRL